MPLANGCYLGEQPSTAMHSDVCHLTAGRLDMRPRQRGVMALRSVWKREDADHPTLT